MEEKLLNSMRFSWLCTWLFLLYLYFYLQYHRRSVPQSRAKWHDTGIEHVTFNCFVVEVHTSWPSSWYYPPHQVSKVPTDTSTTQKSARFTQLGIPSPSIIKHVNGTENGTESNGPKANRKLIKFTTKLNGAKKYFNLLVTLRPLLKHIQTFGDFKVMGSKKWYSLHIWSVLIYGMSWGLGRTESFRDSQSPQSVLLPC